MNDQIELSRQVLWMDVFRASFSISDDATRAACNADIALEAFDERFKPKSTQELQAIFAKGQP